MIFTVTPELFSKEPYHARVEVTMEGSPIEVGRVIIANAWHSRRKLLRARRQERVMTRRNDVNVRLAGQAAGDALGASRIDTIPSELRTPDLQGDLNARQALLSENGGHGSIREHGRLDPRVMRQAWKNGAIVKLFANASLLFTKASQPLRIQSSSRQYQSGIAAQGEAEEAYFGGIDGCSVLPVVQHEIE